MSLINLSPILALSHDDPELRQSLLDNYLSNFKTFADDLEGPVRDGRLSDVKNYIYKVKSSIRMIEGEVLERMLEELEYKMRMDILTQAQARHYLDRIRQLSTQVVDEILEQSRNL